MLIFGYDAGYRVAKHLGRGGGLGVLLLYLVDERADTAVRLRA